MRDLARTGVTMVDQELLSKVPVTSEAGVRVGEPIGQVELCPQ